jgi:hypothetical protein
MVADPTLLQEIAMNRQQKAHASVVNTIEQQLRDILTKGMEPTEPADTILKVLREHNGRLLTTRIEPILQKATGDMEIRLRRRYNMTLIEWGGYGQSGGHHGGALICYNSESAFVIDAADIEERNPAHFSARHERNARRARMLASPSLMSQMARMCHRVEVAVSELNTATDDLKEWIGYERAFGDDSTAIEQMVGLKKK